jgi:hypothetical protein
MRAGDADRESVAERLRGALNEGRLDLHEYDERLRQTYAAKTYGELQGLLSDLPGTAPLARSQVVPASGPASPHWEPGPDGRYPDATRRWVWETWDSYLGAVAIVVTIWFVTVVTSGAHYFWPIWVAGPWGAVLAVQTVRGLGTGEPQKWAARQARKEQEKLARRAEKKARPQVSDEPAD